MKRITGNILCVLFMSIVYSCYPTSGIPDGDQLYVGQEKIQYTATPESGNTTEVKAELEAALATAPNGAIFSSPYHRYPFSLSYLIWNWGHDRQKGFRKWLSQKMGTMPVLMADVNPLLHTTVAVNTLHNYGYFRGTADYKEITLPKDPKKGKVQYSVNFGPLFTIDSIEYRNFTPVMQDYINTARQEPVIHKGDGFSVAKLDEERQRLATLFRNNGFYYYQSGNASYLADTLQNPLHVQLRLQLQDSLSSSILRQWKIGRTNVYIMRANERTTTDSIKRRRLTIHFNGRRSPIRTRVFMSDVTLKKGMLYSEEDYKETISRLSRFDAFSSIDFSFHPADTTDTCSTLDMTMRCTMQKLWALSLEGNLTGKTSSRLGPGAQITLTRRNPFRGAEKLSFNAYGSYEWQLGGSGGNNSVARNSYEYGYGATLEMPSLFMPKFVRRLLRLDPSTSFSLTNSVLKRGSYFNRHIVTGEMSYTYHPNSFQEHKLTLVSLEFDYMNRHSAEFDSILSKNNYMKVMMEDKFLPQIKYNYVYTSQGRHLHPITWRFNIAESGNLLSLGYLCAGKSWNQKSKQLFKNPYAQFLKFETDFSKGWQITDNSALVGHVNIGVIWSYGNSGTAPYSEQFYVGGANSIRAFTARSIGPGAMRSSNTQAAYLSQVGDFKFVANIEYRPRIIGNLHGAVFLDMGNVWMLPHTIDGQKVQYNHDELLTFKSFAKNMALGTGIGLRYDLDFFVIRVDWGIGLHVPFDTGKSGYFNMKRFKEANSINIAIGYPF